MKINGFAIAIRFNKSFSIIDNFGAIMDKLLYETDDCFSSKVYPEFDSFMDARVLRDKNGKNKLTINPENFILELSDVEDFNNIFLQYITGYQTVIADKLFNKYEIRKINRFGCVIKAELEQSDPIIKSIENIVKHDNVYPDGLSLTFNRSQNKPKQIKGTITEDYENEILTYRRDKRESTITFNHDYQLYFRPPLLKILDSKQSFQNFCLSRYDRFRAEYMKN